MVCVENEMFDVWVYVQCTAFFLLIWILWFFNFYRMGATVFVQPLDLVKNRMQLSGAGGGKKEYKTSFHAISSILRNEGLFAMYSGLSAGLLRQATYTTTRLGIYTWLFEMFSG